MNVYALFLGYKSLVNATYLNESCATETINLSSIANQFNPKIKVKHIVIIMSSTTSWLKNVILLLTA